jgi:nitrate/TMAO reductase-like tetraheme cytochrome c subunit
MNLPTRLALAAAIVGTFAAGIAFLSGCNVPARAESSQRWESARQCQSCHPEAFAEWQTSHHGIAFTNPEVRALSDDFRREECMDCHLPRPLAVTGFGKRTLPRRTHFDEGVSCISCHLGEDGGIVARNNRPEVPCKPKRSEAFLSVDACMSCHNQHQTTDQWRASHYAAQGIHCTNCHMPEADRKRPDGTIRKGRSHIYPGAHDKSMLAKAATFTAERQGNELVLALENTGAGHNFPTEERHRAVDLEYQFEDTTGPIAGLGTGGAPEWSRAWRFRQPYRDEPGENTQLPAGKKHEVRVAAPAGATAVTVRMWYRLTPMCNDLDPLSTLLEERKLEWQ